MKSKLLMCAVFAINLSMNAQLGISTSNPKAVLHIDGGKNNEITGNVSAANQVDDVVVDSNGFIGIGNNTPAVSLDIKTQGTQVAPISGIKVQDGAQNENYVITSDANGNGLWKPVALTLTRGVNGAGINFPWVQTGLFTYTGTYIDLAPGKWLVTIIQLIAPIGTALTANDWMWLRSSFSDDVSLGVGGNGTISTDISSGPGPRLMSALIQGPTSMVGANSRYSMTTGYIYLNNTSGSTKRYKYIVGNTLVAGTTTGTTINSYGGGWSENLIYAVPTN